MSKYYNPYKMFNGSFIPNWLLQHKELSSTAKLCYARLAQYMGKDGKCYPTHEQLSNEIGVCPRQIARVLKELETKDFIKVVRPMGKDKLRHFHNEYLFIKNDIFPHDIDVISEQEADVTSIKENHSKRESLEKEPMVSSREQTEKKTPPISFNDFKKKYSNAKEYPEETECVDYFMQTYKEKFKASHPLARPSTWAGVLEDIMHVPEFEDIDSDNVQTIIDGYFNKKFKGYKHSIFHFRDGIKTNLAWEGLY